MNYIFYHKSDLDGKCSGAIALRYFEFMRKVNGMYREFTIIPLDYYDPLPLEKMNEDTKLYFLDIFPQPYEGRYEEIIKAGVLPRNIVVCDHHKTFLESSVANKVGGNSAIEFSGCELSYMWFNQAPYNKVPSWVRKLGRYDVWDKNTVFSWDNEILPFQFGMRKVENDPNSRIWYELTSVEGTENRITEEGFKVLTIEARENKTIMENYSFDAVFDGLRVLACNTNKMSSSTFNSKFDKEKYDAMMPFVITKDGKVKTALYTESEVLDMSEVAKRNGGGGHRKASGFDMGITEFFEKLKRVKDN